MKSRFHVLSSLSTHHITLGPISKIWRFEGAYATTAVRHFRSPGICMLTLARVLSVSHITPRLRKYIMVVYSLIIIIIRNPQSGNDLLCQKFADLFGGQVANWLSRYDQYDLDRVSSVRISSRKAFFSLVHYMALFLI